MLAKRIIPCLDVKDGTTVKGVNFVNFRDAGDPVELGKRYSDEGADELVYLDITASYEGRETFVDLVRRVAARVSIPFTVGGGISSVDDVARLLGAGADKISINSSAINNPELISIVLPVYNGEAYLEESIKSILRQTYSCFELIIVNDCSTDMTETIIRRYMEEDDK